nr:MAG TPA: hypothetical protein [Caudoviricetes sp.]
MIIEFSRSTLRGFSCLTRLLNFLFFFYFLFR